MQIKNEVICLSYENRKLNLKNEHRIRGSTVPLLQTIAVDFNLF